MHIERDIFTRLLKEVPRKEITILLGPRQVGKTYLLKQIKKHLDRKGVPNTFFNLEFPEDARLFNQDPEQLFQLLGRSGKVVLIDEFHYLKNASKLFKAIYDSGQKIKIFASGSSSIEIHKHLKESLAGRRRIIRIFPLNYDEVGRAAKTNPEKNYFRYGSLPGICTERALSIKEESLGELLQAYILKDIKSLIKEENVRAFNNLLYLLAQSQGSTIGAHALSKEIGLTAVSVQRYLDLLEATYVIYPITSFSRNLGNELKKSKKYYFYDLGIRNVLLKDFRPISAREDKGCLIETAVCQRLVQQCRVNEAVHFWRTRNGEEVDFVLVRDREPIPIKVKSKIKSVPHGMKSFLRRYPETKQGFVFTLEKKEKMEQFQKTKIVFKHWAS
jgi:uncharacterized protein